MVFTRSNRLSTALAVLILPCTTGLAQLSLPQPETASGLAVREQADPVQSRLEVETPVYLPEPGSYGLLGAVALGALMVTRRITGRATALAG
jgi:hypothetical protein